MAARSLGDQAKSKVISIRVTEAEHAALVAKYGSATRALRAAVAGMVGARK